MAAPLYKSSAPLYEGGTVSDAVLENTAGIGVAAPPPVAPAAGAPAAPALSGKRVNVVNDKGEAFSVDESELANASAQGYQLESAEGRAVREYVEENKGLSGTARVALSSFANEATFGVTGAIEDHGLDALELKKSEALKRDHAAANILGGVAGFGTSLLYGGEFFEGARVAKGVTEAAILGSKAATKVGVEAVAKTATSAAYRTAEHALAEKSAAALITTKLVQAGVPAAEAAAAAPGLMRKMAASAAGNAVEGAIFSAPKAITEAALGDPERAGETLLYGLGGGALIGAAGPAAKGIFKAVSSGVGKTHLPGGVREMAGGLAEEQAFRALANNNASLKKAAKEAIRIEGGQRGVGRELLESGLVKGVREDAEDYAGRLLAAKNEAGESIGSKYAEITAKAGKDGRVSVADIIDDFVERAAKPLTEGGDAIGREGLKKRVDGFIQSFGEHAWEVGQKDGHLALDEAHRLRRSIDKQVNWSALATTEDKSFNEALAEMRRALEKRVTGKAEEIAEREGGSFLKEIKTLNLRYSRLSAAEKAASDFAEQRALTNRAISPSDYGVGGIGAIVGGISNPLGALGGIASAVGHKLVREEGNALAAKALDRFSKGRGMAGILEANHAVAQQLERVPSVLDALVAGKRPAAMATLPTHGLASIVGRMSDRKTRDKDDEYAHFDEIADRLLDLHSNPQRMQAELEKMTAPFAAEAPGVTAAMTAKATKALSHLAETMPRGRSMPATPLMPERKFKPTKAQVSEWSRRAQVIDNPFIITDRLADLSVTRADVETLGAVYPKIRAEVQQRMERWASSGGAKTLPPSARQKISQAFGIALDPVNPAPFQQMYAQRFGPGGPQQGGGSPAPRRGGGGAPKMPSQLTETQRLLAKG